MTAKASLQLCACVRVCVQVVQKMDVTEMMRNEHHQKQRVFRVTFQFVPPERYSDDKLLSPQQILHYMETRCALVSAPLCQKNIRK